MVTRATQASARTGRQRDVPWHAAPDPAMASLRSAGRCPCPPPSPRSWRERRRARPRAAAKRWSKESEGWSSRKRSSKEKRPSKDMGCRMDTGGSDRLSVFSTAEANATSVPRPATRTCEPSDICEPRRAGRSKRFGWIVPKTDWRGDSACSSASAEPISCRPSDWSESPKANPAMSAAIPVRIKRIPT